MHKPGWSAHKLSALPIAELHKLRRSIEHDSKSRNPAHLYGMSPLRWTASARRKLDTLAEAVSLKRRAVA